MSPLARSLLALAAAALLHAAACDANCVTVKGGRDGSYGVEVAGYHLVQTDRVEDLPSDQCGPPGIQVGVWVTVCDPYGEAPSVELLRGDSRVQISCTWTDGQLCPRGLDVTINERCNYLITAEDE